MYLLNTLILNTSEADLKNLIETTPEIHPDYEGNCRCVFLNDKRCTIHPARTGACRLFGFSSLNELKITEMEFCKQNIVNDNDPGINFILDWVDQLGLLNNNLYPYNSTPYFVRGFNIPCWLDIYFDDSISSEPFVQIRQMLRKSFNLSFCKDYTLKTGIKDKIDKISILNILLDSGPLDDLRELLLSIRDDYPLTGTYFYEEAQAYLDEVEKLKNG
jgi:Fe-S-cluster containining protein